MDGAGSIHRPAYQREACLVVGPTVVIRGLGRFVTSHKKTKSRDHISCHVGRATIDTLSSSPHGLAFVPIAIEFAPFGGWQVSVTPTAIGCDASGPPEDNRGATVAFSPTATAPTQRHVSISPFPFLSDLPMPWLPEGTMGSRNVSKAATPFPTPNLPFPSHGDVDSH
ncbi:hypothetical protein B296_00022447 [Ensete ventricosum]|uniref:Uncharacterized protein n=1 Tax=Ensete ventricosum TaxID=4639 RepID=A0A427A2R2_ENSVE|nr:hypothetical protein B296_00022447 [Ensete ventricosum]